MTHVECRYPNCICIKLGRTCRVAESAAEQPYCSHCHRTADETSECESTICVDGLAEMVDPVARAVAWVSRAPQAASEDRSA